MTVRTLSLHSISFSFPFHFIRIVHILFFFIFELRPVRCPVGGWLCALEAVSTPFVSVHRLLCLCGLVVHCSGDDSVHCGANLRETFTMMQLAPGSYTLLLRP